MSYGCSGHDLREERRSTAGCPGAPVRKLNPGGALHAPCAGYVRVACALYAFGIGLKDPVQCIVFYFLSFVCDELDGRFARMLGQTSTLGAVLDMVTDR